MSRPLYIIAKEIERDWVKPFKPGDYQAVSAVHRDARPYLSAMHYLIDLDGYYYFDDARSIVCYFLSNAKTWRGAQARRIKIELNDMLKEHKP